MNLMPFPETIKTEMSVGEYANYLIKSGFEKIGFGAFGAVYAAPNDDMVVKVGRLNEDGYLTFVRAIGLESANSHFPRIYDVQVFDPDPTNPQSVPYYTVMMERLEANPQGGYEVMDKALEDMGVKDLMDLSYRLQFVDKSKPETAEVVEVLDYLYTEKNLTADVSWKNVMWRGTTPVITDPVV